MKILVIDGQGGGVGKTLITFIRQSGIAAELMAAQFMFPEAVL